MVQSSLGLTVIELGSWKVLLSRGAATVFLRSPGMKIDQGGIAKGYAIDRGVAILRENEVHICFLTPGATYTFPG